MRVAARLPALSPLLIGLPVLAAIVRNLVDVVSLGHPFFADLSGTSIDAYSIFLGGPLYQDPAAGYTPQGYPPVLPLLSAGLDHIHLWTGWPVIVVVGAELGLIVLAAALAYQPASRARADRLAAGAGALGFGALVWWLISAVPFNFLYSPRPDELEWALAFGGLALIPAAAGGSRRRLAGSVLLLSAACWTKQTAVLACVAGLVALGLAAVAGRTSWRTPLIFAAALGTLNLALFAALQLGTDGWTGRFLIDLPDGHARVVGVRRGLRELLEACAPALALATLIGAALVLRAPRSVSWPEGWRTQFAAVVGLFVVIDVVPSAYFRGALGAVQNNYLGVAWGLGLLAAVGFGYSMRHRGTATVAALGIVALFGVSESGSSKRLLEKANVFLPKKSARIYAVQEYPGLRTYARSRTVFHPVFTDLNAKTTGHLYPSQQNVIGMLAGGYQPGYLVEALLNRRFDVAYLLDDERFNEFQSSAGRWEDNYLWKINKVIQAEYRPMVAVPPALAGAQHVPSTLYTNDSAGVYERRPGRDPAPWIRHCFGPFRIAGVAWNIRHGGGLWCRPGGRGSVLRLVRTPALFTEVRADSGHSPAGGSLEVALPTRRGGFGVAGGSGETHWALAGRAAPRGRVVLSLSAHGRRAGATARPAAGGAGALRLRFIASAGGPLALRSAGGTVSVAIPHSSGGPLSLTGTFDSGVSYDLSGLRLAR